MADEKHEGKKSPTMGYKKGGLSQVFQLAPGEKLPDGWLDKPPEGEHPNVPRPAAGQTPPDKPAPDHPQPIEHPDPRHTGRR